MRSARSSKEGLNQREGGASRYSDSDPKSLMWHSANGPRTVGMRLDCSEIPRLWEQGAGGSNPSAPTNEINDLACVFSCGSFRRFEMRHARGTSN